MSDDIDYVRSVGGEALGGRLRRLSERIDRESNELYQQLGVKFEQRWFGVLNQLLLNDRMTVTEIARRLRISHVSVSQSRRSLEQAGLIEGIVDKLDSRRRLLQITPKGQSLIAHLAPLWDAEKRAAKKLADQIPQLMSAIDAVDDALERYPLTQRVLDEM